APMAEPDSQGVLRFRPMDVVPPHELIGQRSAPQVEKLFDGAGLAKHAGFEMAAGLLFRHCCPPVCATVRTVSTLASRGLRARSAPLSRREAPGGPPPDARA